MTTKLKRTLALALAGGSLAIAVPAALAAGGDGETGANQNAPSTFIQDEQQQQRPDREDCPEKGGDGGEQQQQDSSAGTTEAPSV
jgi:hypothetical protein